MAKVPYLKPALTVDQQLDLLKSRGLEVADDFKAIYILTHISYYRLSGYFYPLLQDKQEHIFKPDSSLEQAFRLYCFDRELRQLLSSELEKIEIGIRTQLIYQMSHSYGPFWYQNSDLFKNEITHNYTLTRAIKEAKKSDENFIKSYRQKYIENAPPSWMILEIVSFGTLSQFYSN
jgi:abortive infection bacteriophage resistance protein